MLSLPHVNMLRCTGRPIPIRTQTHAHTHTHTNTHFIMQVCKFIKDETAADVVMWALEARRNQPYAAQAALQGLLELLAPTRGLTQRRAVLRRLANADVCIGMFV
jgi:hypothetical protein